MHRLLIAAKLVPGAEQQVAQIFAESDRGDLPGVAGARHRSLYRLHDLYVHLLETRKPGGTALADARAHPEFAEVSRRLAPYVSPYLPTWGSPGDAVAGCFYHWDAPVPFGRSR